MAVFTGNGAAATPSFTFSSDTDTGVFRAGANTIGFATNGGETARLTAGGDFQVGNLAGTPHIVLGNGGMFTLNNLGQGITFPDGTIQTTAAGSGAVTSVFGRAGVVVAVDGDYTMNQLGDVNTTGVANGNILVYNSGTWEPSAGGSGTKGQKGQKGLDGNAGGGTKGTKGQKGDLGVGQKGQKGVDGNAGGGTKGTKGTKGEKGIQGVGQKGQKGADGGSGSGTKGQKGQKGEKGQSGTNGTKGQKGQTGTGIKGQKGDNSSTNLTNSQTSTSVTVKSSTGSDTTVATANGSQAGVLSSALFNVINNSVQRTGDTMTGNLNMDGNDVIFDGGGAGTLTVDASTGIDHSSTLGLYSRSGAAESSFIGDGNGWTCSQASSPLAAGIRYKQNNAWIGFYYVSASTMAAVYNNLGWGNVSITSSDVRLKESITSLADGALAKVNALNPVQFKWINKEHYTPLQRAAEPTGTFKFGFIANEVETLMPEAMIVRDPDEQDPEPIKDYEDRALISVLCKAVQELSAKVDATDARVTTLEG